MIDNKNGNPAPRDIVIPAALIERSGKHIAWLQCHVYYGLGVNPYWENFIREMVNKGHLVQTNEYDAQTASEVCRKKKGSQHQPMMYFFADEYCEWCGYGTLRHGLHRQHFPLPRNQGGVETVSICENCHNEYHIMLKARRVSVPSEVFAILSRLEAIDGKNS